MSVKIDNKRILESAIHVAERDGFLNMTREKIAEHAKVSEGKVSNAFGSMKQLRRAVMRQKKRKKIHTIIVAGIVSNDPTALKLPEYEKHQAFQATM